MTSKPYELKLTPKIDKWFRKLEQSLAINLLELLLDELQKNPYPRQNKPTLIKYIQGLKDANPKFLRIRVYKDRDAGITNEYRFYYFLVTPHKDQKEHSGYVVVVDQSGPSDGDKDEAVERLKKIKNAKVVELKDILGLPK